MTKIFVALLDSLILNPFSRWLPVVRVDIYLLTHLFIYLHLYSFYIHVFYSFIFIHLKKQVENCYIHHSRVSFFQYDTNQILNCLLLGFPIA